MKFLFGLAPALILLFSSCGDDGRYDADIIVYGATSGGITAAIEAARAGKHVLLIEPSAHIGGATTGGLVWTDYGEEGVVGGLAGEFYSRVTDHYRSDAAWKTTDRFRERLLPPSAKYIKSFEPRIADSIFRKMLSEAGIDVITRERLDLDSGVQVENGNIRSLIFESGKKLSAKVYIDASYEGDLMALAGVSYHIGRESRDTYNESAAGVLGEDTILNKPLDVFRQLRGVMFQPKRYFNRVDTYIPGADKMEIVKVDPYDDKGKLLFGIQDVPLEKPGTGDAKIQAYNVRVVLTSDSLNRIPITRPDDYDSTKYTLLARYIAAHRLDNIRQIFFKIDPVPNLKTDINDGCPFSTDYIGANWEYPEGDYKRREEILEDHHSFTKGLIYFAGHDPRVPESIRKEVLRYGYPKDEYTDNGHWTPQVYIRETRRMIGEYVMTQKDIVTETTKAHPIGMGSYALDSHHLQRVVTPAGDVINEGNFTIRLDGPYEIPYESIVPRKEECANLLVPVCLSSSHVAFGSIRMEPVYMVLGQAAGAAAVLAIENDVGVQAISYDGLAGKLKRENVILKIHKRH
jgi:hypothetical protein